MSVINGVTSGAVAATGTYGVVAASQVAAGYAIPTLMSTFATVVPGVGSTMPLWIGAIQAFAVAPTLTIGAPVVLVVGGVYGGLKMAKKI
jgi:hypothetical protein